MLQRIMGWGGPNPCRVAKEHFFEKITFKPRRMREREPAIGRIERRPYWTEGKEQIGFEVPEKIGVQW